MMVTETLEIRELTSGELALAEPDIGRWFGIEADMVSLAATYPQIFRPEGQTQCYGAWIDNQLHSHTAVRRVNLVTSAGVLKVSLVGAVATNPEIRGQRLASKILHQITDQEIACGQDSILLWTDLWDFYARLGYAPAGMQAEVIVTPLPEAPSPFVRRAALHDLLALHDLHAQKPWRIERDLTETALLFSIPKMDCFVFEADGEILAYACHGKGADFQGWWHELGGSDASLAVLLPHAMQELGQSSATVLIPSYRSELIEALRGSITSYQEGVVALCKPLSKGADCEFFIDGLDSI